MRSLQELDLHPRFKKEMLEKELKLLFNPTLYVVAIVRAIRCRQIWCGQIWCGQSGAAKLGVGAIGCGQIGCGCKFSAGSNSMQF